MGDLDETGSQKSSAELQRQKLEIEVRELQAAFVENRRKARRDSRSWWIAPIQWAIPVAVGVVTTLLTLGFQTSTEHDKLLEDRYLRAKSELLSSDPSARASAALAIVDLARQLHDGRRMDESATALE